MDFQQAIDTRAIELATTAVTKIDDHLAQHRIYDAARLAELQGMRSETSDSFRRVHARLDQLVARWFGAAVAVIGILLALVSFLLVNGAPWK